jgi:hypothetical protein
MLQLQCKLTPYSVPGSVRRHQSSEKNVVSGELPKQHAFAIQFDDNNVELKASVWGAIGQVTAGASIDVYDPKPLSAEDIKACFKEFQKHSKGLSSLTGNELCGLPEVTSPLITALSLVCKNLQITDLGDIAAADLDVAGTNFVDDVDSLNAIEMYGLAASQFGMAASNAIQERVQQMSRAGYCPTAEHEHELDKLTRQEIFFRDHFLSINFLQGLTEWRESHRDDDHWTSWRSEKYHLDDSTPQHMSKEEFNYPVRKPTLTDEEGTTQGMKRQDAVALSEQTTRPEVVDAMLPFEDGRTISATTQFYIDLGVIAASALDFIVSAAANIIATELCSSNSDKPWSFNRNLTMDVLKQIDFSHIEDKRIRYRTRTFGPIALSQLTEELGSGEFPMLTLQFLPEWTAQIAGKSANGSRNTPQQGGAMANRYRIEFTFGPRRTPLKGTKIVFFLPIEWTWERIQKTGYKTQTTVYVSPSGTQLETSCFNNRFYESQNSALLGITNTYIVPGENLSLSECQTLISPQFIEPTAALTEVTNIASSQPPAKRQRRPSAKAR